MVGYCWQFESATWAGYAIAKELCFSYDYDARDRLVMTQDSSLRAAGKWLYTQYDTLNRPYITGLWTEAHDRVYHQSAAGGSVTYPNPGSSYEVLTQSYFDDYAWTSTPGLSSTFISTYASNTSYFYTASNTTYPYPRCS